MSVDIKYTAWLDPAKFVAGQSVITRALDAMSNGARVAFGGMHGQIGMAGGAFGALKMAVGGLAASVTAMTFVSMVKGAIDAADRLDELSQVSGLTVETLSGMHEVAKISGTDLSAIGAASNKLSANLAGTEEGSAGAAAAIKALGLNLAEFRALSADERMRTLAKELTAVEDSADRSAIAMALLGKSGAELLPFFNDMVAAGDLVATTTAAQAAQAAELKDNLARLQVSGDGWKRELAQGMTPALNEAAKAVLSLTNEKGGLRDEIKRLAADGTITRWTRDAVRGLTYVLDAVQYLVRAFRTVGTAIGAGLGQVSTMVFSMDAAFTSVLQGDFAGAKDIVTRGIREITAIGGEWWDQAVNSWSETTLGDRLRTSLDAAAQVVEAATTGPDKRKVSFKNIADDKEKKKKDESDQSVMGTYEAVLAHRKLQAAREDALREYSKEQELQYWREILSTYEVSMKDRLAISRKTADLEVQIMRENAKNARQMDLDKLDARKEAAISAIDAASSEASGLLALGEITKQQQLEQERQLEERRLEIRREYLQARLAMLDPERDPVLYQQISLQIEEAERQHQERLRQIKLEARQAEADNPIARTWKTAEDAMQQSIARMLQGQQTLRQGMASVWQAIRGQIVGEIAKIIAAKVAAFAKERLLAMAGIGTKAAEAGAGAASSQASIPYVGPVLALAAMAAVMGSVMALGSKVPSAARGFDIPRGVNPLTQLHEQEMVLPAEQANVIRDMAGGGARGGDVNVSVRGVPAGDFFLMHKADLVKAMKSARRDSMF